MDYARALLLHQLLKDYQDVSADLKRLRAGLVDPETQEQARSRATGWFNRVYLLYRNGLLQRDDMQMIATPRAAALWLEHVAPLDRLVRQIAAGGVLEAGEHPVETFWKEFADGKLLLFGAAVSVN